MTPMEIALLLLGVIIFVISFLLPNRTPAKSPKEKEKEKEEVRRIMEKELDSMKLRVNEATNETVEYAVQKTERSLEKISNEKIMAVNEYSDTIMEEINKSHKEVMFLYDMLSDKQVDLKNIMRKAEATAKEVETVSETAQTTTEILRKNLNVISVSRNKSVGTDKANTFVHSMGQQNQNGTLIIDMKAEQKPSVQSITQNTDIQPMTLSKSEQAKFNTDNVVKNQSGIERLSKASNEKSRGESEKLSAAQMFQQKIAQSVFEQSAQEELVSQSDVRSSNNNDKILELCRQGKNTVEIARTLGLGVGEVQLVIDLYKR